jgi:hypothetical protein
MAGLTPDELDSIIHGRATVDDIIAMRQGAQANQAGGFGTMTPEGLSPQAQQYLSMLPGGTDPIQEAQGAFQATGGMAQPEKYWGDDIRAWAKQIGSADAARAKAGYSTWMGEQNLGLKQQAAEAKFSTPDADYLVAHLKGWTPEMISHALNAGDAGMVDTLMQSIGAVDDTGAPDYSPVNIQRLAHLEQYHDSRQAEMANQEGVTAKSKRVQGIGQENRAKEAYLNLTGPNPVSVDREGKVYSGPDAEQQAQAREKQIGSRYWATPQNTLPAKPKGAARTAGKDVGNLLADVGAGRGPAGTATKYTAMGAAGALKNKVPGAARAAWRYAFG